MALDQPAAQDSRRNLKRANLEQVVYNVWYNSFR
jgi:hypothetical protein